MGPAGEPPVSGRIARKWRPSLALVLGLTVAALLCLPVAGLVGLRWLGPALGWPQAMRCCLHWC